MNAAHVSFVGFLVVCLVLLFVAAVYFLPTLVAGMRRARSTSAIFLVNLLLGWTGVGWLAALVLAFTEASLPAPADTLGRRSGTRAVAVGGILALLGVMALLGSLVIVSRHEPSLLPRARWQHEVPKQPLSSQRIEQLRQEVARMTPELNRQKSAVAAEQLEVDKLKQKLSAAKADLKQREAKIRAMRNELKAGKLPEKSRARLEDQLAREWEAFKQAEAAVKAQEDLLAVRQEKLSAAQEKLAAMQHTKEELQLKLTQLEAELEKLRLEQPPRAGLQLRDVEMQRLQARLQEIEARLEREKVELEKGDPVDAILDDKERAERALRELDQRFGATPKAKGKR